MKIYRNGDGTGPRGRGPRTGRRLGSCQIIFRKFFILSEIISSYD